MLPKSVINNKTNKFFLNINLKQKKMKKLTLLLTVILITNLSNLNAQGLFGESGFYDNNNYYYNSQPYFSSEGLWLTASKSKKEILAKSGIIAYEHKAYKVKKGKQTGEPYRIQYAKFDDNFNLLEEKYGKTQILFQYNKNNCYTDFKLIKRNKKLKKHEIIEYNDSCMVTKYEYRKKNDAKLKNKWVSEYDNSLKRILAKVIFDKDGTTEKYKWEYDYYEDGKRKQTKYYKKGELKHIWNYTCDDEGKEQKEGIKTEQVCLVKEYLQDSSYIITNRTTDNKGRIRKNVSKYNKNKKLIEYRSYNYKGKLTWGQDYRYDCNGLVIQSIIYRRGGLIINIKEWYYNNNLVVKYKYFKRKGKLKYSLEYKFNNNKQLVERSRFNKKHKLNYKYKYEYNNKGDIVKTLRFNKKDELKTVYETNFTYKE